MALSIRCFYSAIPLIYTFFHMLIENERFIALRVLFHEM